MRNIILGTVILAALSLGFSSKKEPVQETKNASSVVHKNAVWVAKPDGSQQCEKDSAQSLDTGKSELQKANIQVLDSKKDSDGQMRAQMCGLPTGNQNSYLIPQSDLSKALALGYALAGDQPK